MNGKGKGDRVVRRTALDDVARLAMPWDTDDESDVFSDDETSDEFRSTRKTRSSPQTSGVFGDSCVKSFRAPRVPNVDLLIRTSGETRLSDFILWGVSKHAVLCFLEVLWPDFSFTDMCHAVWTYQISAGHARRGRRRFREAEAREGENKEVGDPNDTRSDFFSLGSLAARSLRGAAAETREKNQVGLPGVRDDRFRLEKEPGRLSGLGGRREGDRRGDRRGVRVRRREE
jgi:hypothetical protein